MSDSDYRPSKSETQAISEIVSVAVEGKLHSDPNSKAQAFLNVTLYLQPGGSITIHGCTVAHEAGKDPAVLLPGKKGDRRYFPVVSHSGEIRKVIEQAVLAEYRRLTREKE